MEITNKYYEHTPIHHKVELLTEIKNQEVDDFIHQMLLFQLDKCNIDEDSYLEIAVGTKE